MRINKREDAGPAHVRQEVCETGCRVPTLQQIIFLSASNDWQKPVSSSLILSWHSSRRAADNMITPSCLSRGSQCSFYHDQLVHIQDQDHTKCRSRKVGKGDARRRKKLMEERESTSSVCCIGFRNCLMDHNTSRGISAPPENPPRVVSRSASPNSELIGPPSSPTRRPGSGSV